MDARELREKAVAYTALITYSLGDENLAWNTLERLNADYSLPFASYTREFTHNSEEENRFNSIWRETREAFVNSKVPYTILPYSGFSGIHFLYLTGKGELVEGKKLVFLGSVMPSLQGKKDTALAVMEAVRNDYVIVAPFETGLGAYALNVALQEGGKVCGVLSSELSKCPSENLLPLMEGIYKEGLLLSQFPPSTKREKWHVVLRNRFLSSFGDAFYMAEEKNGGPGWAVFDQAMKNGKKCAISSNAAGNPNFSWCSEHIAGGAIEIKKPKDIKTLFTVPRKRRTHIEESEPDLFSSADY